MWHLDGEKNEETSGAEGAPLSAAVVGSKGSMTLGDLAESASDSSYTPPAQLDETIKEKINMSLERPKLDVNRFPAGLPSKYTGDNVIKTTVTDCHTVTEAKDFVITHKLECGQQVDDYERGLIQAIIPCISRVITSGMQHSYSDHEQGSPSRPLTFNIDKSCSTDDLADHCPVDGLEFLAGCFTSVGKSDLLDILQQCGGDIQWAVNLLLDSGYEYNDPPTPINNVNTVAQDTSELSLTVSENTPKTEQAVEQQEIISTPSPSPSKKAKKSPVSLMVICHDSLKSKGVITKNEYHSFADQRLHRLRSIDQFQQNLVSTDETASEMVESSPVRVKPVSTPGERTPVCLKPKLNVNATSLDVSKEDNTFLTESVLSPEASQTVRRQQSLSEGEALHGSSQPSVPEQESDDFTLTLSPQLAKQLISMFGPVGFHITPG